MRLGPALLASTLVGLGLGALPLRASDDLRLAPWEVEAAIPVPPLDRLDALAPRDFGLDAFPASPLLAEADNPDDEAPAVAAPVLPEPTEADFAVLPDDPPSLVEEGQPDPTISVERVAQQLRILLARPGGDRSLQQQFNPFYQGRGYQPLFVRDGIVSERGQALLNRLAQAGDDGLDPAAFRIELPRGPRNAESVARLELALARVAALYAAQASGGRTQPRRLSGYFDVTPPRIEAAEALATLARADSIELALDSFNPPHPGFRKLRAKLIEMRGERREMTTTEVTRAQALRERDLIANLERWRWLPRDLGPTHIWVNAPDYHVNVIRDGQLVHRARTVVGRAETQTPVFSDAMNHIVFNPSWYVPLSIVRRSMLGPASRNNTYFARQGIEVTQGGRQVDPSSIDWSAANVSRFAFRQPPGERNALGRMKFMFPNRHAVYLHDTPSRRYFSQANRALSNGCVRVQNPEELAELLLNIAQPGETWTVARIRSLYGPSERTVRFRQSIPIHLVYFTMTVDSTGALVELPDIYGHNARVRAALNGGRG
ncbi:MAG: murein L,D-transpeptidase [Phreatobacter sp.]